MGASLIGLVWLGAFALGVGWVAQVWKRRLGSVWTILAMAAVGLGGPWLTERMAARYDAVEWARPGVRRPVEAVAYGIPAVLVALAVTLIPRRKGFEHSPGTPDGRLQRKCPHCAETILAEARLCRHCGRQVRPVLEAEDLPTLPSGPPTPPPPKRT